LYGNFCSCHSHCIALKRQLLGPEHKGENRIKVQVPVGIVHGVYTSVLGQKWSEVSAQQPKADTDDVLKSLWRDVSGLDRRMVDSDDSSSSMFVRTLIPVEELPLACMDAVSVLQATCGYSGSIMWTWLGQSYFMAHSSHSVSHLRNFSTYYSRMTHEKVLLLSKHGIRTERTPGLADHSAFFSRSKQFFKNEILLFLITLTIADGSLFANLPGSQGSGASILRKCYKNWRRKCSLTVSECQGRKRLE
jgi:hypothetical protein